VPNAKRYSSPVFVVKKVYAAKMKWKEMAVMWFVGFVAG